ncbi:hypothetical protein AB0R12_12240 [Streptomyces niveus]
MNLIPGGLIVSLTPSPQSPWQTVEDIVRLAAALADVGADIVEL